MTNLQIFSNNEFGEIRVLEMNNEPWFVGKDVAEVLGYQNSSKALKDHVDEEDKLNNESLSSLGQRGGWLINESGLYSLILSSKLPNAKKFKRWVTSEILPTIRRTGGYMVEGLSKELQAIFAMDKKQQVIEAKVDTVANDFAEFKKEAPLFNIECEELQKAVRGKAIKILGGKKSNAYNNKSLRTMVFTDIQKQIKTTFDVRSYKAIKRVEYGKALEIINEYVAPDSFIEIITVLNSQMALA